jgi:hypothetical protein
MPIMTTFLTLTLCVALTGDDSTRSKQERKPSAIAPSLPALTDEEEDKQDDIIDRFIQQDIGKLRGAEGKKALAEFNKLGAEAIPALVRGMNKAAAIDDSCPAVVIAKKLQRLLGASNDPELLQYARENIGAGVKRSRHMGTLQDLKVFCTQRKNLIARQVEAGVVQARPVLTMSVAELATASGTDRGARLKGVLAELGKRDGDEAIGALGSAAAASYDEEIQKLAREQLYRNLSRQKEAVIKEKLKDDRVEVRVAAARVAGEKKLRLGDGLIDLLADDEPRVRDAAHAALIRLNNGSDLGPKAKADERERSDAARKWREWWAAQKGK